MPAKSTTPHRFIAVTYDTSDAGVSYVKLDVLIPDDLPDSEDNSEGREDIARGFADEIAVATNRLLVDVITPDDMAALAIVCDDAKADYSQS